MLQRTRAIPRVVCSSSSSGVLPRAVGHVAFSRRWASSFRAGAVSNESFQVKAASNKPLPWQPSAKYMKYKPVRWLVLNAMGLATYQLCLELGFTAVFGLLIYRGSVTAEAVKQALVDWRYPFTSWISLEGCEWKDAVKFGPFALNPHKLTAVTEGHSIANGLLPIQVLLLVATYPLAMRVYAAAYARYTGKPVAQAVAAAATTTKETAHHAAAPPRPTRRPAYLRGNSTRLG